MQSRKGLYKVFYKLEVGTKQIIKSLLILLFYNNNNSMSISLNFVKIETVFM